MTLNVFVFPPIVLYLVLIIGFPLALWRPDIVLIFTLFVLNALNYDTLTFTRLPELGSLFNLHDAFLVICIVALISIGFQKNRQKILIPVMPFYLILILIISVCIAFFDFGFDIEIVRSLRWAIAFPLYWIIAANIIDTPAKARMLVVIFIISSGITSVYHILYAINVVISGFIQYGQLRNVKFGMNTLGLFFIFMLTVYNSVPKRFRIGFTLILASCGFSLLINQTRSIWIAGAATFILYSVFFENIKILSLLRIIVFMSVVLWTVFSFVQSSTGFDSFNMVSLRISNLSSEERELAGGMELQAWLEGNLVFGRGLGYTAVLFKESEVTGFRHLGHVTILAQTGIIGYILYFIIMPIYLLRLHFQYPKPIFSSSRMLVTLCTLGVIYQWILMLFSSSYLAEPQVIMGVIYGAMWASIHKWKPEEQALINIPRPFERRFKSASS